MTSIELKGVIELVKFKPQAAKENQYFLTTMRRTEGSCVVSHFDFQTPTHMPPTAMWRGPARGGKIEPLKNTSKTLIMLALVGYQTRLACQNWCWTNPSAPAKLLIFLKLSCL